MVRASSDWPKRKEFEDFLISLGIVGFFEKPVQIKRGLFSNFYVNWRTPSGDAFLLDKVTDYILDFIKFNRLKPKCIYGVPEGATKWGIVTQLKWAKGQPDFRKGMYPVPQGRSVPKEHGMPQDRYFVGAPKGPTVIIEDVTVEGESLLNVIDKLQSLGIPIVAAIALTDRNEKTPNGSSVEEIVKSKGVKYCAMSNALSFLPIVYSLNRPGKSVGKAVEEEFKDRGTARIRLLA